MLCNCVKKGPTIPLKVEQILKHFLNVEYLFLESLKDKIIITEFFER